MLAFYSISILHCVIKSTLLAVNVRRGRIVNYREWRNAGRRISTSAVEGTINQLIGRRMCKAQHMCWSKRGAHLLLQVRCATLNGDLLARFQRWFPSVGTRRVMMPWDWLPHRS